MAREKRGFSRIDQQGRHIMHPLIESLGNCFQRAWNIKRKRRPPNKLPPHVLLAADDFEIGLAKKPRERREPPLRPFLVKKMIMATGALHFRAQKHLRRVGRRLNGIHVGVVADEPIHVGVPVGRRHVRLLVPGHGGIQQVRYKQVVGLILKKALINKIRVISMRGDASRR